MTFVKGTKWQLGSKMADFCGIGTMAQRDFSVGSETLQCIVFHFPSIKNSLGMVVLMLLRCLVEDDFSGN